MSKRGQISIFFIFVIVLLIAFGFLFYIQDDSVTIKESEIKEYSDINLDSTSLVNYVEDCIKDITLDGLFVLGIQGGYYELPENLYSEDLIDVAYYYSEQEVTMPSVEDMLSQLNLYIEENLDSCVFIIEEQYPGYDIQTEQPSIDSVLNDNTLNINLNYPITFGREDLFNTINEFSVSIENIRLNEIHQAISKFMENQLEEPDLICTSCLVDIGEEFDLIFDIETLDSGNVLFTISDFNSDLDDEPYFFTFTANYPKYNCNDPNLDPDSSFYIDCKGL